MQWLHYRSTNDAGYIDNPFSPLSTTVQIPSSSMISTTANRHHSFFCLPAVVPTRNDDDTDMESSTPTPLSVSNLSSSPLVVDEEDIEFINDDERLPVVCARGVCAVADEEVVPELCLLVEDNGSSSSSMLQCEPNDAIIGNAVKPGLNVAYLWPRALLLGCSVLYGTNFPLGRLMNESLPPSAATSARMLMATVALSPFLFRLKPELRNTALLCGCFTALGYVSQSIALVELPAATVSFLGALVVVVCPALAVLVEKRKMSFADAPQTWISAGLCLIGVGVLELLGGGGVGDVGWGDVWSVLQAVGFGTSFFITERMMASDPDQALPITAMQCAVSAAVAGVWASLDGTGAFGGVFGTQKDKVAWLLTDGGGGNIIDAVNGDGTGLNPYALPGLLMDPSFRPVALAAVFTGIITTAANRVGETVALGKLTSSEASVLLATEPLWAAVFASYLLGETLDTSDAVGGLLVVVACVFAGVDPKWLREKFGIIGYDDNGVSGESIENNTSRLEGMARKDD